VSSVKIDDAPFDKLRAGNTERRIKKSKELDVADYLFTVHDSLFT
jgi:hypothetical protein